MCFTNNSYFSTMKWIALFSIRMCTSTVKVAHWDQMSNKFISLFFIYWLYTRLPLVTKHVNVFELQSVSQSGVNSGDQGYTVSSDLCFPSPSNKWFPALHKHCLHNMALYLDHRSSQIQGPNIFSGGGGVQFCMPPFMGESSGIYMYCFENPSITLCYGLTSCYSSFPTRLPGNSNEYLYSVSTSSITSRQVHNIGTFVSNIVSSINSRFVFNNVTIYTCRSFQSGGLKSSFNIHPLRQGMHLQYQVDQQILSGTSGPIKFV